MARLGDVCSFFSGTGFPNAYQGQKTGKYPFYKVGDISKNVLLGNRELISSDNYIDDDTVQAIKGTVLPPKTVVFAKIGEALRLNRRAITNCYCLVDNNAMGILADNTVLDELYFYYFMCSVDLQHYCESTTVPSVRKTRIAEIEIPLPSLEEQRRIAAVLDKVSDLIAKRRAQLDKLDLLVKSRFVEMFGDPILNSLEWPIKKLNDLSQLITNGNTPKGGSENYVSDGILFLRSQNVWRNRIDFDDVAFIDEATHASMAKSSLHDKDILITKTGRINTENSSLGRAALFRGEDNSANINGHVYLVRLNDTVVPEYVVAILTGEPYRKYIRKVCVGGIDKRQINLDQVEDFPIILPPYEMQEQFAAFVGQTDKSKLTIQQSLDKLEMLKKALMQQYFG